MLIYHDGGDNNLPPVVGLAYMSLRGGFIYNVSLSQNALTLKRYRSKL